MMEIPPQARNTVLIVAGIVILFWAVFFGRKVVRPSVSPVVYGTRDIDRSVGWVAAREADRVAAGRAHVILLLPARENEKGSLHEQQAFVFVQGFQNGMRDDQGKERPNIKILGKKYRSDDPLANPHGWPPLSVIQDIIREFPDCNLVVSFCDPPQVKPAERNQIDPTRLPHVIALHHGAGGQAWKELFDTGLVEVLFSPRPPPNISQTFVGNRALVEGLYWIVTKENLAEMTQQAGGK